MSLKTAMLPEIVWPRKGVKRNEECFWKGYFGCCLEATRLTLEGAHAAQVNLGDRECAHVARENKLAAVVQVLLLNTREPFHHGWCDFTWLDGVTS